LSFLEIGSIRKTFGGIVSLNGVDMKIKKNSISALIGPNGSGKTTLFNVISGFFPPDSGHVLFKGEDITGLSPNRIALKGLMRTFQIPRLFHKMTVLENMFTAPKNQKGENLFHSLINWKEVEKAEAQNLETASRILELLSIEHLANEWAGNLSGGQKKLLELARILMADPEVILLDEPVAGVNPTLSNKIFESIIELRNRLNKTFLIVEHNMDVVLNYCEWIGVMHRGQIFTEGTPQEIIKNEEVTRIYFGVA